jgi:multicomponent Na+:H+ antiporter subunit D
VTAGGWALPWLFVVPLIGALVSLLTVEPWRARLSLALLPALWWATGALIAALAEHGVIAYVPGGWDAPLGIALRADGLAVGMVVLTTVVFSLCAIYSAGQVQHADGHEQLWPLAWFLLVALNSIWLSADIFNLYVGLELLGLAAVGLVALKGSAEALPAAMRYLLAALLGSLAYLLGVALLYAATGSLAITDLASLGADTVSTRVALALMALGLMLKTALFPLHTWLPPAHGGALPPVSALLSALVVKASFYILLRLWLALDAETGMVAAAQLLGLLGSAAVFWGGWMAWRQTRLKYLVAYSTVAQIGYLFLFFPLVTGTSSAAAQLAWDGTLLMLIAHALAKAGMFLAAGNLVFAMGSGQITDLNGIGRFRPLSLLSFGVAGVSLMGLPPSGGFTAKWLLLQSALASGQGAWVAVLMLGGLLSAVYVFKVLRHAFVEGPTRDTFRSAPLAMELSALLLALASLLIGLGAHDLLIWLRLGSPLAAGISA